MTMMKSWADSNTAYKDDTAFDSGRVLGEGGEDDGLDTEHDDVPLGALPDIRPARLLLAEEDDELRRSIAGQLRNRGYEVDEAFSGYEAIALIARQSRSYDLIITDLQLYGMNGLELINELRASPRSADSEVPVIVLGEEPTGETAREAVRLHAVIIENLRSGAALAPGREPGAPGPDRLARQLEGQTAARRSAQPSTSGGPRRRTPRLLTSRGRARRREAPGQPALPLAPGTSS